MKFKTLKLLAIPVLLLFCYSCTGLQVSSVESSGPKLSKAGFEYDDPFGPDIFESLVPCKSFEIRAYPPVYMAFGYSHTFEVEMALAIMVDYGDGVLRISEYLYIYKNVYYVMEFIDGKYQRQIKTEAKKQQFIKLLNEIRPLCGQNGQNGKNGQSDKEKLKA